jgi:hypothetical protein
MERPTRETLIADARQAKAAALEQRDVKAIDAASDLLRQLGDDRFTEQERQEISLIAELDAIGTALYRHFDHDGRLLYVGISLSAVTRTAQHRSRAPWFSQITRIEIEWHKSRSAAALAEKRAIKAERPLYNIVHNEADNGDPDKPQTRTVRAGTRKRRKCKSGL